MDYKGKNCPVCNEVFKEDDDIVVCPKCGAPYHRECYAVKGKCIFPDLHREKKSWIAENGFEEPEEKTVQESVESDDAVICRHCGHKNPKDTIVCEKCGDFLFGPVHIDRNTPFGGDDESDEYKGGDPFADDTEFSKTGKLFVNGVKVFDLGFGKDEDFDGIKGKELSEYVGSNSLYYLPVFSSIHKRNVSKFHVAAFLFNGSWYIFRKQYLKGALLMIVTTLLYVLNEFISYFYANPMWEKATDAIRAAANGGSALGASWMPQWSEYMSWMAQNCSFWEGALMMLPYVLSLISWVIMFVCGFKANKGYYKAVRKNIKKIKEDNPDKTEEEIAGLISAKGGTSIGMAWMLTACQAIILGAFVMFIAR